MLVWRPGNFKILIVGSQVDAIPIVERRIGKVISLPIDIHLVSLEELNDQAVSIPTVDLILGDKIQLERFYSVFQSRFLSSRDFIPSLGFHLKEKQAEDEIEFLP